MRNTIRATGMLPLMLSFYGGGLRHNRILSGNRSMPEEMQKETMAAAQRKRKRKMDRPQGWYNG